MLIRKISSFKTVLRIKGINLTIIILIIRIRIISSFMKWCLEIKLIFSPRAYWFICLQPFSIILIINIFGRWNRRIIFFSPWKCSYNISLFVLSSAVWILIKKSRINIIFLFSVIKIDLWASLCFFKVSLLKMKWKLRTNMLLYFRNWFWCRRRALISCKSYLIITSILLSFLLICWWIKSFLSKLLLCNLIRIPKILLALWIIFRFKLFKFNWRSNFWSTFFVVLFNLRRFSSFYWLALRTLLSWKSWYKTIFNNIWIFQYLFTSLNYCSFLYFQ